MDLLAVIGLITLIYFLVYLIYPWFVDCDLQLKFYERFGKPISSLQGKVVWITGASSGIGEHLAYVLARVGCKLVLTARRKDQLETVKKNCIAGNQFLDENDVEIIAFDVCNLDMHEQAFKQILDKFGKLDILVNNAGRSQRAQWENIDLTVDREMFDLNVFSVLSLSRLVGKYFLENNSGHFVVNSSLAGILSVPFSATYCGSKHALHGYFETFRIEKLDKNVSVTMVCPGPIQTNFLAQCFTEKPGEKYGVNTEVSQGKMSPERCATLMSIAIANKLDEVWITKPKTLQLTYLKIYYPNIGYWIFKLLGPKFLQNLRDAKQIEEK